MTDFPPELLNGHVKRCADWTLIVSIDRMIDRIKNNDPHPNDIRRYGESWRKNYVLIIKHYATELAARGHRLALPNLEELSGTEHQRDPHDEKISSVP